MKKLLMNKINLDIIWLKAAVTNFEDAVNLHERKSLYIMIWNIHGLTHTESNAVYWSGCKLFKTFFEKERWYDD